MLNKKFKITDQRGLYYILDEDDVECAQAIKTILEKHVSWGDVDPVLAKQASWGFFTFVAPVDEDIKHLHRRNKV